MMEPGIHRYINTYTQTDYDSGVVIQQFMLPAQSKTFLPLSPNIRQLKAI